MKVNQYSFNNLQEKKVAFGQKGRHEPDRLLTEKTMKVFSDAISSLGIASIELQNCTQDYAQRFDKEITRSELDNVDADVIAEAMEYTPLLIETILTDRSASGKTRCLTDESLRTLIDLYSINPELTEQLLLEKDDKGNYKFTTSQIGKLVEINNEVPELLPLAMEAPVFVNNAFQLTGSYGKPLYGIEDIKFFYELSKTNPDFTLKLIKQKNKEGSARFTPEQVKYFVENFEKDDSFIGLLLDVKRPLDADRYRFNPEQIIELTQIAKDAKDKKLVTDLMKEYAKCYSNPVYLDSQTIVDIVKNPDVSLSDLIKKYEVYSKLALQVYALLNGRIDTDEVEQILSLKGKYEWDVYSPKDLLSCQNLFTEKAYAQIKKEYSKSRY